MKRVVTLVILVTFISVLLANDLQQPDRTPINLQMSRFEAPSSGRWVPSVEFDVDPQVIAPATYYDYLLGGYNEVPMFNQPEASDPYGYPADGRYHAFMYQENAASLRRIYYTYIDAEGNISTPTAISPNSIREGFSGIAMDYVTGNPFVAWHNIVEADGSYDCSMSYDMFNVVGGPGLWKQPFICIDNPEASIPYTGYDTDEFIWPQVRIGPSPLDGHRRVYVYGNNFTNNPGGTANYNSLLAYTDVQYDEVNFDMSLTEWVYQSFDQFDDWHYNDVKRAIKDLAVSSDGQVAFIGHAGTEYFLYHSADYGETWDLQLVEARWDVFNPQNTDGSYYFTNDDGSPAELLIEPNGDGGHFNCFFTDDNTKIMYMTAFGLNTVEGLANATYLPAFFEPKIVYYDIVMEEFKFVDIYVEGLDPNDDQPMIPFDLDEDDEVDSWDADGFVEFVMCWPTYFYGGDYQDGSFHESNFKLVQNEEMGWIAAIFSDGRYVMENYFETPGYEDWAETSQIAICVSNDHGVTWSEPAYLNAKADDENYYEELDGMLPAYIYPTNEIEYIDDTHGRIPIVFFDDFSYGSFVQTYGQNIGGAQMYAELIVEFPEGTEAGDNEIVSALKLSQNYPNPFNPETNIAFELKESGNVSIEIYNLKGQKVKTLVNDYRSAGDHTVMWNGTDENNNAVSSGIYYYKMKANGDSATKKMVLMK